jgi:alginate O-acetyltransferase complex protein AlgI
MMQKRLGAKGYRTLAANHVYRALARGLTFTWFTFTLFWFWSNWRQIEHFTNVLGLATLCLAWLALFVVATLVLAALEAARNGILRVTWAEKPLGALMLSPHGLGHRALGCHGRGDRASGFARAGYRI